MSDEAYTFEQTKARLDEILVEVRKKDTSLEQSLELLEEGVRLANRCNELIDQTSWRVSETTPDEPADDAVSVDGVVADDAATGGSVADEADSDEVPRRRTSIDRRPRRRTTNGPDRG